MRLASNEQYAIVRKLADHTDGGTYYVQAVVRDARTDSVIDTVNLTDRGDNRFSAQYQVPADTSGVGRYLAIETSVYTDSGYTTKSSNYGDEVVTIQVKDEKFGGGGGVDINYDKIRKMVEEVVTGNRPVIPETDVQGPLAVIRDQIVAAIIENRAEEPVPTDLSPVMDALVGVEELISRAEESIIAAIPQPEALDYERLTDAANRALEQNKTVLTKIRMSVSDMKGAFADAQKALEKKIDGLPRPAAAVVVDNGSQLASLLKPVEKEEEKEEQPRARFKGIRL